VVSFTSPHLWRCGKTPRGALLVGPRTGLDALEDGNNLLLLELGPYLPVAPPGKHKRYTGLHANNTGMGCWKLTAALD